MKDIAAVILAAGKGTRMKSALPKVVHKVCGVPLILHVVRQVKRAGIKKIVVVAGYRKDLVVDCLKNERVEIVEQARQLGTGHALLVSAQKLRSFNGDILVLDGDVFFEDKTVLRQFFTFHAKRCVEMSILTTTLDNPFGYGRIVRESNEKVVAIREELDATPSERKIKEINTGIYLFKSKNLFSYLKGVKKNNRKKEYYLTSVVDMYLQKQKNVGCFNIDGTHAILGVNDRVQLSAIQKSLQAVIIREHQRKGVTVVDPANTYIEDGVAIGRDTCIYPYTYIEKNVRIGAGCTIGPFCKICSHSFIKDDAHIGSFVEIVRSRIGQKTRIKHLSYIGDATIGRQVNIGAGTITANYDGIKKHKTKIGDKAFIGSDTILVAPLTVGKEAKTGAGTVVPKGRNIPRRRTAVGIPARIIK
ncbi:MAG: NTP transferase domain-containing protein [Candidatus Omnitrophica bacterium]|nr:NTP transferase domain-containing protein [Candidatus Omnitrophota bacterium]